MMSKTTDYPSESNKRSSSLSPLSYPLIGLSPSFWSYNPFLIKTIHKNILLINGLNVFLLIDKADNSHNSNNNTIHYNNETASVNQEEEHNVNDRNINRSFKSSSSNPNDNIHNAKHVIPISKVEIVGIIQYVHYKSNGSTNMIIDDGTSFIDCIYWNDDYEDYETLNQILRLYNNQKSNYSNNSICYNTTTTNNNNNNNNNNFEHEKDYHNQFQVGDVVQIKGQLKVLSIDHNKRIIVRIQNNDHNTTSTTPTSSYTKWEAYTCHREIQVHSIEKIHDFTKETLHWLKSLRFIKQVEKTKHIRHESAIIGLMEHVQEVDNDFISDEDFCSYYEGWEDRNQSRSFNTPVLDGLDIYNTLSKKMKNDVLLKNDTNNSLANSGDNFHNMKTGSETSIEKIWREYYGRKCCCSRSLTYMNALAYCHCLASKESLDEKFHFRDALLVKLLEMESEFYKNKVECIKVINDDKDILHQQNSKEKEQTTNNNNHTDDNIHNEALTIGNKNNISYFNFQYDTIYQDVTLQSIAQETVSKTSDPKTNLRRIFVNTFFHLRKDGILHLHDPEKDVYILLSIGNVLIPYMEDLVTNEEQRYFSNQIRKQIQPQFDTSMEKEVISPLVHSLPPFLNSLPRRKYKFLKKVVEKQRNQNSLQGYKDEDTSSSE